jgi:hypothetical protein
MHPDPASRRLRQTRWHDRGARHGRGTVLISSCSVSPRPAAGRPSRGPDVQMTALVTAVTPPLPGEKTPMTTVAIRMRLAGSKWSGARPARRLRGTGSRSALPSGMTTVSDARSTWNEAQVWIRRAVGHRVRALAA